MFSKQARHSLLLVVNASEMDNPNYTWQQYKKFNGQTVMKALQSMNYHATTDKLTKYIASCIDQREEDIKDTVKRVLSNAVANGFLVTRGKSYVLMGAATDSSKRSRQANKKNKLKAAPKARRKYSKRNKSKAKTKT